MAKISDYMIITAPLRNINVLAAVRAALEIHRQDIIDLQVDQMDKGMSSESDQAKIEPPYTRNTVNIKRSKGQQADWVTLEDTGRFKQRISPKFYKDKFIIRSSDKKTEVLTKKYGEDIFGLQPRNKYQLGKFILPKLQELIKRQLVLAQFSVKNKVLR